MHMVDIGIEQHRLSGCPGVFGADAAAHLRPADVEVTKVSMPMGSTTSSVALNSQPWRVWQPPLRRGSVICAFVSAIRSHFRCRRRVPPVFRLIGREHVTQIKAGILRGERPGHAFRAPPGARTWLPPGCQRHLGAKVASRFFCTSFKAFSKAAAGGRMALISSRTACSSFCLASRRPCGVTGFSAGQASTKSPAER